MQRISLDVVDVPQGIIIYRGPSQINGKGIIVVATGLKTASKNAKTGEMIQVYILVDNVKPFVAVFNGQDEAICGDCPHRYVDGAGTCYVNPAHGPNGVMIGIKNGSYPVTTLEQAANMLAGKVLRIGSYGDPAAVPINVWDAITAKASGWTGYTHQWRKAYAKGLQKYCMASIETKRQHAAAKKRGWRTFRIRHDNTLLQGEMVCPASEEADKRLTCVECGACSGGSSSKASVAILAHGTRWKKQRLTRMVKAKEQHKAFSC